MSRTKLEAIKSVIDLLEKLRDEKPEADKQTLINYAEFLLEGVSK